MTRAKGDYLPEKIYQYIYRRMPRLCVDAIIRDRRGVVLSRRDIPPDKGQWHFPGGRVHMRERLEDAVKRICREETGLKVRVVKIIGAIEYLKLGRWGQTVSIAYLIRPVGGKLRGSWQARKISFFSSLPRNTEFEVKTFLLAKRLIRK